MHSFKTLHLVTRFWMCIQCERYSIRSLNVLLLFQCTISVYMQRLNILSECNVYFSAVLLEMYKNRKPKWGRCLEWAAGAVVRWCMGQSHAGSRRVNISSNVCKQWYIWPSLVKDFEGGTGQFFPVFQIGGLEALVDASFQVEICWMGDGWRKVAGFDLSHAGKNPLFFLLVRSAPVQVNQHLGTAEVATFLHSHASHTQLVHKYFRRIHYDNNMN